MECPHCGFMNLLDSGECVRCRKPLPKAPAAPGEAAADNLDLSEVKIEALPDEFSEPPAFPEHGEEVDVSSSSLEPVAPAAAAGIEPEPPGEDTETADVLFTPSAAKERAAEKSATGLKPAAPVKSPSKDEASASYEGSDPELQELSRFFQEVREQRGQAPETRSPEEQTRPPASAAPEPQAKSARKTKADTPPALFPSEEEEPPEPSPEPDAFAPEFKESALPGPDESEPSLSAAEPAPSPEEQEAGARSRRGGMTLLGRRIEAGLVDLAIHLVILALLGAAAFRVVGSSLQAILLSEGLLRIALPLALVMVLIFLGFQTFFAATAGQTPGQMLLRLRVEDETGDSPLLGRALLRALALLACLLPLGLPMLSIPADPERRSLADKISRTRVVRIGNTR
jgi:uncharacterized RDD family membrane protein YckC